MKEIQKKLTPGFRPHEVLFTGYHLLCAGITSTSTENQIKLRNALNKMLAGKSLVSGKTAE
jgi:hypothetical protein